MDPDGDDDAAVIFEGDFGGQIYFTCPMRHVRCDQRTLERLLADLDHLGGGALGGARLHVERLPVGSEVAGGMGGGKVVDWPWLHDELDSPRLADQVLAVIQGRRDAIDVADRERVVWSSASVVSFDVPAEAGVPQRTSNLLAELDEVLSGEAPIAGSIAVYGFGDVVFEIEHPSGGRVKVSVSPARARVSFSGFAADSRFRFFAADDFGYDDLVELLRGVIDGGLAMRLIHEARAEEAVADDREDGWDEDEEEDVEEDEDRPAAILVTLGEDGEAADTFWSLPTYRDVDWLMAELGPVEMIPPIRGRG